MLPVIIVACTAAVALPFLMRLRRGSRAVSRAAHYRLRPLLSSPMADGSAMRAATSSLAARTRPAPLIVVHHYRHQGTVTTGLTVVGQHPERIAALVAGAAGAAAESVDHLDLPEGEVIRYGRRGRRPPVGGDGVRSDAFAPWVASVLAGATADAVLSIGVTPAARWEILRTGDATAAAGWRGRIVAAAGDPITADALAAGCGTQLRDFPLALSACRPGDAPVVAGGAALALLTGFLVAARALINLHVGAALGAVEAGVLAALALTAIGGTGILRVTESCWRHWQRCGVVVPERPWRLSVRRAAVHRLDATEPPATRRTVAVTADHWAVLCCPSRVEEHAAETIPSATIPTVAIDTVGVGTPATA
ncbi:MAG: hypothetical protein M3Y91_19325 [Actinomycetota bacterium]|nr:hypothetical protein [Actinomycetota bacterium]